MPSQKSCRSHRSEGEGGCAESERGHGGDHRGGAVRAAGRQDDGRGPGARAGLRDRTLGDDLGQQSRLTRVSSGVKKLIKSCSFYFTCNSLNKASTSDGFHS